MTKQILFIQGGGAGAHEQWDSKLVASLARELGQQFDIRYPQMPNEGDPSYPAWKATLEQEIAALDDDAILIGHSLGGTILITALAEHAPERKLAAVFLIAAPFIGPGGWPSDGIKPLQNLDGRLSSAAPIYLYHGSKDSTAPCAHVDLYKRAIPRAHVRKCEGRDHQFNNDLAEVAADIRRIV
jgi:predicted alpha/beta hydrolase family esterase